jgi:small subunit ribosomal protein S29
MSCLKTCLMILHKSLSQLTTTKEYVWTKRETTPAGAPLTQLADLGIQRVKFSNDIFYALCEELKNHANAGQ